MTDDSGLIGEFVMEATEQLNGIEERILQLESLGTAQDKELINSVFRAVHSTKGAAGFLGLESIGALAHALENVLNLIRNDQLSPTSHSTDVLLSSIDCLKTLLADVEHSNEIDVTDHRLRLERLIEASYGSDRHAPALGSVPPAPIPASVSASAAVGNGSSPAYDTDAGSPMSAQPLEVAPPSAIPAATAQLMAAPCAAPQSGAASPAAAGDPQVRVAVRILDRLMSLAGELVLARNQLLQVVALHAHPALEPVAARVDQVASDLQEVVMQSRMQPIGNVFGKFNRIVRDLSAKLGKKCELRIEGSEVELDKTILEAIGDPLTHLVRNSLDHGVEAPETRRTRNKAPYGTLLLRACHQAGKVRISIVDDGAGIDADRVKRKAVERGVISAEQAAAMNKQEAVGLIFHPGFSTADQVTDLSGRGVGMDVVKTNIVRIGGSVDVETALGDGTSIHITLPLTLAIIPSLIVRSGGERFAVPQADIVELVRVKNDGERTGVETIKNAEMLRLRDELLPLVRLDSVFGAGDDAPADADGSSPRPALRRQEIVVVENGPYRYGLIVDELRDPEEIVVKPLGRHLAACTCLAGATVLGDGEVALILDPAGIAVNAGLAKHVADESRTAAAAANRDDDAQELLLFCNAPSERFAVPMAVVKRIERIDAGAVKRVGDREVRQYDDSTLPLLRLERHVTALPPVETARPYIIVFGVGDREVGLFAPDIFDIRRTSMDVDTHTFRQPGIVGSLVIDRQTVRLVDVYETAVTAHPEWKLPSVAAHAPTGVPRAAPRILLAEDSHFFRGQVRTFLESQGFEVEDCEDGQAAWETLNSAERPFQLIVTDIEMPRLDGFEFCRAVRADERFSRLPIIAVTSLAGEDDRRRGSEVGITDYQVKMDRDRLVASVRKLTSANRR